MCHPCRDRCPHSKMIRAGPLHDIEDLCFFHSFKRPGSAEERTVLEKAEGFGCHRVKSQPPEADVDVLLPTLEVTVGEDFELDLRFVNRSDQRRSVNAYISGNVVYYTGVTNAEFMMREPTVTMKPNESEPTVQLHLLGK